MPRYTATGWKWVLKETPAPQCPEQHFHNQNITLGDPNVPQQEVDMQYVICPNNGLILSHKRMKYWHILGNMGKSWNIMWGEK